MRSAISRGMIGDIRVLLTTALIGRFMSESRPEQKIRSKRSFRNSMTVSECTVHPSDSFKYSMDILGPQFSIGKPEEIDSLLSPIYYKVGSERIAFFFVKRKYIYVYFSGLRIQKNSYTYYYFSMPFPISDKWDLVLFHLSTFNLYT